MQMIRTVWEPAFSRPDYFPTGYFQVSWDSLTWNWQINVFNGKFIYWTDNFARMTPEQESWPLVCGLCDPADTIPLYPNKEDLSTYGYHEGAGAMRRINSQNWLDIMKDDEDGGAIQKERRGPSGKVDMLGRRTGPAQAPNIHAIQKRR